MFTSTLSSRNNTPTAQSIEMDDQLDIFGQQPFFTMNTQICFAFPLTPTSSDTAIIATLSKGLERLYADFPWLACEVVNEGSRPDNTGVYKFRHMASAPRITVKDLRRTSMPTMQDLRSANFPMRMLDEEVISPRKTFAQGDGPAPVFLIQANFITGGLLLTFAAQHNTMDMTGQAHIIELFSKACRGEEFTAEELLEGNRPRGDIVPLLDDEYTPGPELGRHVVKPSQAEHTEPPPKFVWAYFNFSHTALSSLKSDASSAITAPAYISTDDALTALLWQSILRARLPRLALTPTPYQTQSTVARAIDVRPYLNISPLYHGPIQDSVYTTLPIASLTTQPIGATASSLRSDINPEAITFHASAIATFLSRTPNKALFSSTADFDLGIDLIVSSWARVRAYEWDFGFGLGMPEAVWRPSFRAVEGLVFFMPRTREGGVSVAVSLREEDMERLRGDAEFVRYGEYVG